MKEREKNVITTAKLHYRLNGEKQETDSVKINNVVILEVCLFTPRTSEIEVITRQRGTCLAKSAD